MNSRRESKLTGDFPGWNEDLLTALVPFAQFRKALLRRGGSAQTVPEPF